MGASFGMNEDYEIKVGDSLTLRYLLHAHSGLYDGNKAEQIHKTFARRPAFQIRKPTKAERHRQYEVERLPQQALN